MLEGSFQKEIIRIKKELIVAKEKRITVKHVREIENGCLIIR